MLCTVIKNPLLSLFRVNGREILLVSLSLYSNVAKVQIAAHHLKGVGIERLILFSFFLKKKPSGIWNVSCQQKFLELLLLLLCKPKLTTKGRKKEKREGCCCVCLTAKNRTNAFTVHSKMAGGFRTGDRRKSPVQAQEKETEMFMLFPIEFLFLSRQKKKSRKVFFFLNNNNKIGKQYLMVCHQEHKLYAFRSSTFMHA